MRFYKVANLYFGTQADAHGYARDIKDRKSVTIHEIEFPTDKEGVLLILNGEPQAQVLRTWGLTPRGGMVEEKPAAFADTLGRDKGEDLGEDDGEPVIDPPTQATARADWLLAAAHFGLDQDQFAGDEGTRRSVVDAYKRGRDLPASCQDPDDVF